MKPSIDWSKPELLQTRDGRKVKRVLCTDLEGVQPIVVLVDGNVDVERYSQDGRYYLDSQSDRDIIPVPREYRRWVNFYEYDLTACHLSRDQANEHAGANRIACIEVVFKHGDGL